MTNFDIKEMCLCPRAVSGQRDSHHLPFIVAGAHEAQLGVDGASCGTGSGISLSLFTSTSTGCQCFDSCSVLQVLGSNTDSEPGRLEKGVERKWDIR